MDQTQSNEAARREKMREACEKLLRALKSEHPEIMRAYQRQGLKVA